VRIAFDPVAFLMQRHGGISRHFAELVARLPAQEGCDVTVLAPLHSNAYLRSLGCGHYLRGDHPRAMALAARSRSHLDRTLSTLRPPHDIVHETYFSPRAYGVGRRRVVTVNDLIPQIYQGRFGFGPEHPALRWMGASLERADHVTCISETTRRDLLEWVDLEPERVSVVYLGVDADRFADRRSRNAAGPAAPPPADCNAAADSGPVGPPLAAPYLLCVGARYGYKNFPTLVRAWAGSARLRDGFELVVFGEAAFSSQERRLFDELGVAGQVHHITGDDDALSAAYRHAAAFVYPSLYEGFGIPPLEAMASGCPVVASRGGSIPEVVGDAAELFDPEQPDDLAAALLRVLESDEHRSSLVRAGHDRSQRFTWANCARETARLYRQLA
jgi:glycosyltransferase involved in cell wall biosynthesis